MYHVRKIKRTKKDPTKASYVISLPKRVLQKAESSNPEISSRLEHFPRVRYAEQAKSRRFLVAVSSHELPKAHSKDGTTTIQRSGRTSRYVIIPKKVCRRFGWKTDMELVIGLSYGISKTVQDAIYKAAEFLPDVTEPEVLAVRFQRYQDMKDIYSRKLTEERTHLEEVRNDILWKARHDSVQFERMADVIDRWKKNMRRDVWNRLFLEDLVAVPYNEYVRLRADCERYRKKRRRELMQRHGIQSSWNYKKNFIRGYGTDWDARREAMLDDPDMLNELRSEDPETYRLYGLPDDQSSEESDQDQAF